MKSENTNRAWRFTTLALAVAVSCGVARADFLDTTWTVSQFQGEAWFVEPEKVIGETQTFEGGFAEGFFYSCDFTGQSMTYTAYGNEAFFENPEFALFEPLRNDMTTDSQKLFVHRVTCNGNDLIQPRVFYPVVTNENRQHAWYLYEGGVFSLTATGSKPDQ
jgi:hypothetical protein